MLFIRIVFRNLFRHPLRSGLTVFGLTVAIMAFVLLRTVVGAWYAGIDAASASRLVTRHAVSLTFSLPLSYRNKIRQVDGVAAVSYANWFGGVYINEKNFFPQFAIEPQGYLQLYPEFVLPSAEMTAFVRDRKGAIAGRKLAAEYGWCIGDVIPLRGTIYQGNWSFVLRGIYTGIDKKTDETQFFFHWDYLNESIRKIAPNRADKVGVYLVGVERPDQAAAVSQAIDGEFRNSLAETLTETEKAFQLSFVAMTEAILLVIQVVSFLVIVIIMVVTANTMAMNARERRREYATLKALGFPATTLIGLITGEALLIALTGGGLGIALSFPVAEFFAGKVGSLFPIFAVTPATMMSALAAALLVGLVAAASPAWTAARVSIIRGLGAIG